MNKTVTFAQKYPTFVMEQRPDLMRNREKAFEGRVSFSIILNEKVYLALNDRLSNKCNGDKRKSANTNFVFNQQNHMSIEPL